MRANSGPGDGRPVWQTRREWADDPTWLVGYFSTLSRSHFWIEKMRVHWIGFAPDPWTRRSTRIFRSTRPDEEISECLAPANSWDQLQLIALHPAMLT